MAAPIREIERTVVRTCFEATPSEDDLQTLGDVRVWRIYRDMVRSRLLGECRIALPRTARAAGDEAFGRAFVAHLAGDPPRTRFFREVVLCFARSAIPAFRADATLPKYAAEVCEWEAARWEVGDVDDRVEPPPGEFSFDAPARLAPTLRLLRLTHAVHEKPAADSSYAAREVHLCVHRRADESGVRTSSLTPVGFALLSRLARGEESVQETIRGVASELGVEVDARFVDEACGLLAGFLERRFILGAR